MASPERSLRTDRSGVKLTFRDNSTVTARAIVLAMPRRAIELLQPEGEVLGAQNTDFRHDLASVSRYPAVQALSCCIRKAGGRRRE